MFWDIFCNLGEHYGILKHLWSCQNKQVEIFRLEIHSKSREIVIHSNNKMPQYFFILLFFNITISIMIISKILNLIGIYKTPRDFFGRDSCSIMIKGRILKWRFMLNHDHIQNLEFMLTRDSCSRKIFKVEIHVKP